MKESIPVVIMTSRGPRHSYFCSELAKHFSIRGIVVDDRYRARDRVLTFLRSNGWNPFRIARSLSLKKKIAPFESRDRRIEEEFFPSNSEGEFPSGIPVLFSRDPNGEETLRWIRERSPDFLAVFGTRMIRPPVLSLARCAALNLHTGLSPFCRGGQCTFWCLYEGDLDHLGVTVHHLSDRIDGGDIIYTARPEIGPTDTVRSLECKLVALGTDLMTRALREVREGKAPRIPQREKGKLFLSKEFTLQKRLQLEERLKQGWLGELVP